jgi:putative ABC transport system permease protein
LLAISPDYLRTMRIPLLAGRALSIGDTQGTQISAIANHTFVEKYLHGVNPIGQQILFDKDAGFSQPITIVGISGDVMQNNTISGPVQPEILLSYPQLPASGMLTRFMIGLMPAFVVRTNKNSPDLARDIRLIVKTEAPDFAMSDLVSMNESVQKTLQIQRMTVLLSSAFAWVALILSAFGLYGVLAYLMGQRVREIGIRLALGATRRNIFALVFRQGLWMIGGGLVVGWLGALFAARWIRSFLFGTTAHDPLTYVLVGLLIVLASAIAIFIPARRAAKVDPMVALRYE